MSVRKTRTFQQMVMNTIQLLIFCYLHKYTDWSINSIKWKTIFSSALSSSTIKKWGQFLKTPSRKLHKLLFSMWMGMLWQVQKATASWKYLSVDLQYLMFNFNLKYNIKLQLAFKILKVKELLSMPSNFGHTKRKWVNTFIVTSLH